MKRKLALLAAFLILIGAAFLTFQYYSYLFARTIKGQIVKVEKVSPPVMATGQAASAEQLFSFAVAIRDQRGEIHTASSEDRQWAVAEPGKCVEAKFYPYAPWQLEKAGTYHGARLLRLYDCGSEASKTP